MIRKFIADLHIHSLLSPCAEVEMTPRLIVTYAQALGIDIIAITDHNASSNVSAAIKAAQGTGVTVIPGMELQTQEEIHLVCLFPALENLLAWQEIVDRHLPFMKNDEAIFGAQIIVDEQDELIAVEERMLLVSCDLTLEECVESVLGLGGICIPAHVDRPAYSVISQIGFIPPDISFAAVELSRRTCLQTGFKGIPENIPKITASDAHRLVDLQSPKTCFYIKEPTLQEIILALRGEEQRKVVVEVSQR